MNTSNKSKKILRNHCAGRKSRSIIVGYETINIIGYKVYYFTCRIILTIVFGNSTESTKNFAFLDYFPHNCNWNNPPLLNSRLL